MFLLYNKRRNSRVDGHAERVSASVRGEALILARSEILKQVQDDIWRHLLFLHPFGESQFNTYVLLSKYFNVRQNACLWPFPHQNRDFHKTPQLGKIFSPTGNIFFPSWALFSAQLGVFLLIAHYNTEKMMSYCKSFSSKWQSIRLNEKFLFA